MLWHDAYLREQELIKEIEALKEEINRLKKQKF